MVENSSLILGEKIDLLNKEPVFMQHRLLLHLDVSMPEALYIGILNLKMCF